MTKQLVNTNIMYIFLLKNITVLQICYVLTTKSLIEEDQKNERKDKLRKLGTGESIIIWEKIVRILVKNGMKCYNFRKVGNTRGNYT